MRITTRILLSLTLSLSGSLLVATPASASCDGPAEIDPCPVVEFCRTASKGLLCNGRPI